MKTSTPIRENELTLQLSLLELNRLKSYVDIATQMSTPGPKILLEEQIDIAKIEITELLTNLFDYLVLTSTDVIRKPYEKHAPSQILKLREHIDETLSVYADPATAIQQAKVALTTSLNMIKEI